ncbi:Glycerol-3-phosphate acyltransferase [Zhongshania aliphaticivorans]|uniref:Glycerol-3-phosphate acyltransferase n=1 Tax=Zhongshania aliphaticivorans TaxID=1470434 RepID=A0A5S9PY36_9GAMM|nr:1-acyl-sn-glycerol-3-phosphate acyltransferase [Zhongshania aliphaticivorans]CAA0110029.1 Glycerol-3-phosphate acyltransferase [Zhongshania aliphaticivorans]CAA0117979.1 Glycerol-3-phosphate acyltransferase [Zhongshania aliphaticivorans]CAA0121826.1 Glycerol-3-phosphate acyltransferase [Zhongshania aliphaticivorans]
MQETSNNPWPSDIDGPIVFIVDSISRTEKYLLEKAIRDNQPKGASFHIAQRQLRQTSNRKRRASSLLLELTKSNDNPYFVPLRICWQTRTQEGNHGVSLRDLITGNREYPSPFQQKIRLRKDRNSYSISIGLGATLSQLKEACAQHAHKHGSNQDLVKFIDRSAFLALEKTERLTKGARYKIPQLLSDEVIRKPAVIEALSKISESSGRSMDSLIKEAKLCLNEMSAKPNMLGTDMAAALGRFMYTRGFDKNIDFAEGDIDRIRKLLKEKPVAFLFTHKSHMDGFLLMTIFHDQNLTPLHLFGGINMNMPGIGPILRRAGGIFIRRSFQNDPVYKVIFKNYIDYLGEKRFPLMWALEGTRSRTGKLMPPRYGLINYVVSAHMRDDAPDLILMPVSITYDQVPEVADYDALQAGGKKRPESTSWFMEYISGLKNPHGKIHVRFGEGVPISEYIDHNNRTPQTRNIQKIAFELAVDANNATPITVNSLICYVVLEHGHKAITFSELNTDINELLSLIKLLNFSATEDVRNLDEAGIRKCLEELGTTGVIDIFNDGIESVYMLPSGGGRTAAYYRNGLIHFFITSAIADMALLAVSETGDEAIAQFHNEALKLRDMFKYEFFFEGSSAFIVLLEKELELRAPNWRDSVRQGSKPTRKLLAGITPILGHGTLRPFLEAYLVLARALRMQAVGEVSDPKALINHALTLGKQRVLQKRIHCEESVSGSYFENAIKIAESLDLLKAGDDAVAGRQRWLEDLRETSANVRFLASMADAKRLQVRTQLEK